MKKSVIGLGLVFMLSGCSSNEQTQVSSDEIIIKQAEVIEYKELLEYIDNFKVGDIINLENTNYLSSYAIPGRWKHTLFYLGTYQQFIDFFQPEDQYYQEIIKHYHTQDEILVLDSNSSGVKIRTFDQMANLKKESYLKALSSYRFNENSDFIKQYLNGALNYLGTPYDYNLVTYDDSALYCSELVYYALQTVGLEIDCESIILDHKIISPTDLSRYLESLNNVNHTFLLEKQK